MGSCMGLLETLIGGWKPPLLWVADRQELRQLRTFHWQFLPNRSGHVWLHPYNPAGPTLGGDGCVDSSESVPEGLVACNSV